MADKPQNVTGMRDHLPPAMLLRQHIISTLTGVFERYGFEPLATSVIEYDETLAGKIGDDEKLIYRLDDSGGKRKLALRYDQTVPLARVVAQYASQLQLPWRRYAVGQSFRGERPQRGRYRELWQADVDIVGSASPLADAEIVAVLTDCLLALGFRGFTTLLNHRQILAGMARVSGLDEAAAAGVYRALDKLDKIGPDGVRAELEKGGVTGAQAERIVQLALIDGSPSDVLEALSEGLSGDERALAALDNLRDILAGLRDMGVPEDTYAVAPRLARGLSYYTGCVFEVLDAERSIGSLLGGGRYDELIGQFAGRALPTVGLAFGIERLHDLMAERGMGPQQQTTAQYYVTLFPDNVGPCLELARELRATGLHVVTALDANQKLGKQFQEADRKGVSTVVVLGPDELAQGVVKLKNLKDGNESIVPRSEFIAKLSAR
ncbi:MAG: histidine--tRNA ligase [Chloroflexales bacterium]|nr:histidine--tRNA ligase [Chloroflexales bacterium]